MTYGDIYNEFCEKFPNAEAEDYRPAVEKHIPELARAIPNAIIVLLKDGSKVIYITEYSKMKVLIDIDSDVYARLFDPGAEDYGITEDDLCKVLSSVHKGIPIDIGIDVNYKEVNSNDN